MTRPECERIHVPGEVCVSCGSGESNTTYAWHAGREVVRAKIQADPNARQIVGVVELSVALLVGSTMAECEEMVNRAVESMRTRLITEAQKWR